MRDENHLQCYGCGHHVWEMPKSKNPWFCRWCNAEGIHNMTDYNRIENEILIRDKKEQQDRFNAEWKEQWPDTYDTE